VAYRAEFASDIVIDMVGFRRQGHNEQDIAALTQPRMQSRIATHPGVVTLYAGALFTEEAVRKAQVERLRRRYMAWLRVSRRGDSAAPAQKNPDAKASPRSTWMLPIETSVPLPRLQRLVQRMTELPQGFVAHREVQGLIEQWRQVIASHSSTVDWRLAENLAYASLLANGYAIRFSGLDVGRGTFYQRHAVWRDQGACSREDAAFLPLRNVDAEQGEFDLFDSPLTENAILAFEYGYSVRTERALIVWEAQYGDFVNGAQVVVDHYISTGESKWGYRSGLVVLLPHGYEGFGPEHSSAHLGRFLQLCADDNIRLAVPSTASQMFHLLRRQALIGERKPLVVMTPKSGLYSLRPSHSPLADLVGGQFHPVLADPDATDASSICRVILTSGKFYYDVMSAKAPNHLKDTAVLRLEQFYPFPHAALARELSRFPGLRELVWAQEEAKNHGAWQFVRDQIEPALPSGVPLTYVGRRAAAPSAACDADEHLAEQRSLALAALGTPSRAVSS
jgi:2-oxoglutarate dehydrogenase E1 component